MGELIRSTIETARPELRLQAIKALEVAIPLELLTLFRVMVGIHMAGLTDDPDAITVVLIHGIRTDAVWQELLRDEFKNVPSFNIVPLKYGFFNALGLFGPFRNGPIKRIRNELHILRLREPKSKIVLIAHSYGTYIVSKLLSKAPSIRFHRIILCGSIVKCRFPWEVQVPELSRDAILNDVGHKDVYPLLATCGTFGYGSSGRLGFGSGSVHDRFFDYGHSDFFTPEHIQKYWKPFILNGEIVASEFKRPTNSYWVSILSVGPIVIAPVLIVLLLVLIYPFL